MEPRNQNDLLRQAALVSATLEKLMGRLSEQSQQAQADLQQQRERGQAHLQQAMQALFQQQQQRTEVALRPKVVLAWQIVAGTVALLLLILAGGLLLLKQTHQSLQAAQVRLEAIETRIDVQQALQHVDITSCGGRPCVRVDKQTPSWNSASGEYILVDGKPAKRGMNR